MCVIVYVYMSADVLGGQRRTSDPLRLKLKVVMRLPVWVLRTELGAFMRLEHALSCSAISPVSKASFDKNNSFLTKRQGLELESVSFQEASFFMLLWLFYASLMTSQDSKYNPRFLSN